jgi:hypothetical protein
MDRNAFAADFERDIASHQMQALRDDGVHRHLRFKRPGTMCMHFDIITWPGYLCYTGDMGTYVFHRLEDMFQFFRADRKRKGVASDINPQYWGEKLQATDRGDGFRRFSAEKFSAAVVSHLVGWLRENRGTTTKEERRDLWKAVQSEVLGAYDDSGGYRKQCAANDFSHWVNKAVGNFAFSDFWGTDVEEYTHRFLWCCHALVWAIGVYDAAKEPQEAQA